MELADLMSGIAVVIDDAFGDTASDEDLGGDRDSIFEIVDRLGREWNLPFYTAPSMPAAETWPNLLRAASFVLLDWRLWRKGASQLEQAGIEENVRFLEQAKDYFVPVFIFTNESPEDVQFRLPPAIYREEEPEKNFVFIRRKAELLSGDALDLSAVEDWVRQNASVYALKTWEQAFHAAKSELFGSMYSRSPDWPRVFWKAYEDDGADPSSSLTHLINDSLRGRMRADAFEANVLGVRDARVTREDLQVPREDLRALISEASFRPVGTLPAEEIRCGDVFGLSGGKFLLNLRPDCDCVPRGDMKADDVELYCVEGKRMSDSELRKQYQGGHFAERVWESVAFFMNEGKSARFDFRRFHVKQFSEVRNRRIGRLLHPYLTRIQQRYGLYLQRQGLPRIPQEAVVP